MIVRLEECREAALAGMDSGLKERQSDSLEARLNEATPRVGELTMAIEILHKERKRQGRAPLAARRSSNWATRLPLVPASLMDCNAFAWRSFFPVRRSMLSALGRRPR